jgi:hypothetical protein
MRIENPTSVVMLRLSTKQKQEVYSISSLLLHLIVFIVLLVSLNSCGLIDREEEVAPAGCDTFATVKDLRGLDGCGFVLVLDNGEKLEPVATLQFTCSTGLDQKWPSLMGMEPVDGKRVKIGYKEVTRPSICMVGKTVEITCITEVSTPPAPLN